MKQNVYEVEKNVEKILNGGSTGFLSSKVSLEVQRRLKGTDFKIFVPFSDAEKVILYADAIPDISLFRIECYKDDEIKHSSIMGSLFGLNITSEKFGDIVKWNNNFYVYLMHDITELVINELGFVGSVPVSFKEVPIDYLSNYEREYEEYELIVSSLRIDTVISRLVGCNRDDVNDRIRNQEIFVNDITVRKSSNILAVGDIFSIRRCGKFRFREIIKRTKKDNFIIAIDKYI